MAAETCGLGSQVDSMQFCGDLLWRECAIFQETTLETKRD